MSAEPTSSGPDQTCRHPAHDPVRRRTLLKGALAAGAVALPLWSLGEAGVSYAVESDPTAPWNGDVLVVLSFRGGIDGLSVLAPTGDPNYLANRPLPTGGGDGSIGIPEGGTGTKVVAASDPLNATGCTFTMHPSLAPLFSYFDAGQFGAVVAAGLPAPNRSHFDATEEIEDARPGTMIRTGWINRLLSQHAKVLAPFTAVQLGSTDMPESMLGPAPALGMSSIASFQLSGSGIPSSRWQAALGTLYDVSSGSPRTSPSVRGSTGSTLGALSVAASIPASSAGGYTSSGTSKALKDAARLIKANSAMNLGVRVITLDVGNWDMHVGLGRFDDANGWMTGQLSDVAKSLAAFAADLQAAGLFGSTTLVTMSEFGRRVDMNDSYGVDHGWGNNMLLLGGHIKAGLSGRWPGLDVPNAKSATYETQGDVTVTSDYRSVFADILKYRQSATVDDIAGRTTDSTSHSPYGIFPRAAEDLPYASTPAAPRAQQVAFDAGAAQTFTTA